MTEQEVADRINSLTPQQLKVYEDRLRRMARRQGLTLLKSRRRDPRATDYGGYMLSNDSNYIVAGAHPNAYSMSIDEIERYLTED